MLATKKWVAAHAPLPLAMVCACLLAGCAPPGPRALLEGEQLIKRGEYQKAVEKLKRATDLLPQNAQAWNHLGLAYHGAGQAESAIRAYQQALAPGRNLAVAHYNLGCLYFEQGNYAGAVDELRAYTVLQPNYLPAWEKLAVAQLRLRQFDVADKSFRYLLSVNPKNPEAMNALGIILLHQRNRTKEAIQYFNAALQQQSDYAPALFNLGLVSHYYLNNRPAALQKYREYLALNPRPENWQTAQELANQLELELNPPPKPVVIAPVASTNTPPPPTNPPLARASVTNAPRAEPSNQPGTNAVAVAKPPVVPPRPTPPPATREPVVEVTRVTEPPVVKPATDRPKAASPVPPTNAVAKMTPAPAEADASASTNKPGFFQRLNPFKKSAKKPASLTPLNNPPVNITNVTEETPAPPGKLSSVTPLPPNPAGPRYTYHSPARPEPGNHAEAGPHFTKGLQAHRRGQLAEAIAEYKKALQLDPAYFEAQHNLALATNDNGDLPQALREYETALAIQPGSTVARQNFALALQDGNYFQDAANELEKLLAASPAEPDAHLSLANLYAQHLGQKPLAREHYLKVLQLNPRHPNATDIRYWLLANP